MIGAAPEAEIAAVEHGRPLWTSNGPQRELRCDEFS